ncbi:hypothetical protein BJ878DRAFT_496846 [Calycina marina]|uniref:DUF4604 domain-containing protein n=1 Tax=Calycina marina TaxID=1763456 RepID=A0A9P8CIH8_9HELO|nr:hypothetical protein BJ878DRAFT_496846 [Calycina marina]
MSKFQAKNLHYNNTLPPFLARLQANKSDRADYQAPRPKKARNPEDEAEDEPVYFDEESGDTLTKDEWEKRDAEKEKFEESGEKKGEEGVDEREEVKEMEKVAVIGTSRKRKAGKIVGGDEEEDGGKEEVRKGEEEGKKAVKVKPAKKGKKVKLSFGDDE